VLRRILNILCNRKGNEIVAVALILLFLILAVAPYIRTLGETTKSGIENLNQQMEEVLNNN
jgi:predicted PurR-regulated permease PerM